MISSPRTHRRPGFTLAEMLVVIGIIAVIASITLVMLGKARRSADRSRLAFQLQTLSVGLQAYETDFNSLPITTFNQNGAADDNINADGLRGARTLCKALMGPAGVPTPAPTLGGPYNPSSLGDVDGKIGFGFAVPGRSGVTVTGDNDGNLKGKTYGPYLAPDKFQVAKTFTTASGGKAIGDVVDSGDDPKYKDYDDTTVLLDANGKPILYYPVLNPQPAITVVNAYVGPGPTATQPAVLLPMYRFTDNSSWLPEEEFRKRLGDTNLDDMINPATATTPAETPAVRGKYILWSCGPDGFYGTNPATEGKDKQSFDDVTNFQGD